MVERVEVDLRGTQAFSGAVFRYAVVERVARSCLGHGVAFLAFGFGTANLRLVLDGDEAGIREVLRGVKVGTARAALRWGVTLGRGSHLRTSSDDVTSAVVWAHLAPGDERGPLATPWSSHRDLLGFRYASFFDPRVVRQRVDPREVHARCGGEALPDGWPPPPAAPHEVSSLLRIAAAVLGVLPADRRCFRMFVHLSRAYGLRTGDIAHALALTPRRVRQLGAQAEPLLGVALTTAGHPMLSRVP
jgi:hypothetical protein